MKRLDFWNSFKTASRIYTIDKPVRETIIRYKDVYISVLESEEGIEDLSWSTTPGVFHVPIREFWEAQSPPDDGDRG